MNRDRELRAILAEDSRAVRQLEEELMAERLPLQYAEEVLARRKRLNSSLGLMRQKLYGVCFNSIGWSDHGCFGGGEIEISALAEGPHRRICRACEAAESGVVPDMSSPIEQPLLF